MASLRVSKLLSFKMAFALMHASITDFFDRIPIGRILNRFLKDMGEIDNMLGYSVSYFIQLSLIAFVDLAATVIGSSPIVIIFLVLYLYFCLKVQQYYMHAAREVTRLRSMSASPTIQAFSESIQGGPFIRAFDKQTYSLKLYLKSLEIFHSNSLVKDGLVRWFTVRLSLLSLLVLLPSIIINLFFSQTGAGLFALLTRYLLTLVGDVGDFLDNLSNTENTMVAFERCGFFLEVQPESGYKQLAESEKRLLLGNSDHSPNEEWPKLGLVQLRELSMKYREGLPSVLKNINLDIPAGTKLGVVGRTGAGKSTLLSSLYRLVDHYEGQIMIDGVELRNLDLKELRSSLSIIPQEPYLFADSIRNNIDPLTLRSDNEIVKTLAEVGLWNKMKNSQGLETRIEKGGANLSQGEKQLICISRALLFKKKLVLMDEATANVDPQSEATIQRLIREKFEGCTLIMIAHRLQTVMLCDKILVMDSGQVLEFGDRETLKQDTSSHFHGLLNKHEEVQNFLK